MPNPKPPRPPRLCDRCGKPYYRSNRLRLWTRQNPGHRAGWGKDDVKLCTNCMAESSARTAAKLASARIVTINLMKNSA
jgi:hypothetical protein